jgi:16S rRNA (uracil1498-N3)-methyltransferase
VVEATILIGPEGGWSDQEIAAAHDAGAIFRRLGPRRLRAETAAIAAATEVGLRYGDLLPGE